MQIAIENALCCGASWHALVFFPCCLCLHNKSSPCPDLLIAQTFRVSREQCVIVLFMARASACAPARATSSWHPKKQGGKKSTALSISINSHPKLDFDGHSPSDNCTVAWLNAVTSSIAASPLPFIVGGQLSDTWAWSALSLRTSLATVVEEHKPRMPLVSLFSKITFTSDVLTAADPFSCGRFDPRSPGSPRALTYYRDPPCLYNYYLRWSSKIRLNWQMARPSLGPSLFASQISFGKRRAGQKIWDDCHLFRPISTSTPPDRPFTHHPRTFVSALAECFVSDVLRAEFRLREKRKVIYSEVQRRRVLGGVSVSW